ncbi:MAG: flagellar hook protein FlgE, partial [Rhodoferax sp.]|nr:flagellar hook protein FlgE [Rhodoferax sp.]
ATTSMAAELNLNASAPVWNASVPNVPLTTYGTSLNVYDSQGSAIPASLYMRKIADDTWQVYTDPTSDATATASLAATLTFDTNGQLASSVPAAPTLSITSPNPNIGTFSAALDLSKTTQYATAFAVTDLTQDGYAPGDFVALSI